MELSRILIRELNDYQVIELREVRDEADPDATESRTFPIVIGLPEAQAIDRRLKGIPVKRPQTHDLLAGVIQSLGAKLESITINDLADHTFFATLDVRKEGGELIHVDSRPSDAIALGIAGGVPIYVAEHVLDSALADEL
jgi:bifunctional DNase/RNase